MSGEEGLPINGTVLALILIFIPGIVCYGIVASLAPKKERENLAVALQMFLYGIVSYMILYLLQRVFPELAQYIHINSIKLLDPSKISDTPIDPIAIMAATVIGVLLGLLVTLNLEYNILMKICRKCRITRRFGDNDTWDLIQNLKTLTIGLRLGTKNTNGCIRVGSEHSQLEASREHWSSKGSSSMMRAQGRPWGPRCHFYICHLTMAPCLSSLARSSR